MTYASKWESAYARYLDAQVAAGAVLRWHYEPIKFILAPKTTYSPDFMILYPDGMLEFVEIKGFRREDALVKYKLAAARHPEFSWRMVERAKDGGWKDIPAFCFPPGPKVSAPERPVQQPPAVRSTAAFRPMSYDKMIKDPTLGPILKMKPRELRDLRIRLSLSASDFAERIGMSWDQYEKIEAGRTSLYHYRHVIAIKEML